MTHVIRKQPRGPNHPSKTGRSSKILASIRRRNSKCRANKDVTKPPKLTAKYGTKPVEPAANSRRNHQLLRRLKNRKFVNPTGHITTSLRKLLANQGIHQMTRMQRKWESVIDRREAVQMPEAELNQFNEDFKLWYKQGCPDSRETYFWRIKYCALIELGMEYRYWRAVRRIHEMRYDRGLKTAISRE
jgi:hypothetical protein